MEYRIESYGVEITFPAKPPAEILAALKAQGFRWNPRVKAWHRRRVVGAADLIGWIEKRTEPQPPDGPCWKCGDAAGRFRSYGAATPVLCNRCHREHEDARLRAMQP